MKKIDLPNGWHEIPVALPPWAATGDYEFARFFSFVENGIAKAIYLASATSNIEELNDCKKLPNDITSKRLIEFEKHYELEVASLFPHHEERGPKMNKVNLPDGWHELPNPGGKIRHAGYNRFFIYIVNGVPKGLWYAVRESEKPSVDGSGGTFKIQLESLESDLGMKVADLFAKPSNLKLPLLVLAAVFGGSAAKAAIKRHKEQKKQQKVDQAHEVKG